MQESPIDWARVRLVIFDVDGTLYRQSTLRWRMLRLLLWDAFVHRSVSTIRIVRAYRKERERLAEAGAQAFEAVLRRSVAAKCGVSDQVVAEVITEWIERRPLSELGASLYPDILPLFEAIRGSGRKIGILSDYPIRDKLDALGLEADYLVAAGDPSVGVLKPDPKGLVHLMRLASEGPETTVLIGDRADRDGVAARSAGVPVLLRSRPVVGYRCFERFDDLACELRQASRS